MSELFSGSPPSVWEVLLAVAAFIAGWILSIFVRRGVLAITGRLNGVSPALSNLLSRIAKYFVILIAIGVALGFLGASVEPVLASAIIVGIVAFLALRGIADNFAAGVVIQTRRPLKIGDEIETAGFRGTVTDLNARSVLIRTRDGRTVHVPNAMILSNPLQNYSEAGGIRSEIEVRVQAPVSQARTVQEQVEAALEKVENVHRRPLPVALLLESSPERQTYRVRLWHHPLHRGPALDSATHAIAAALDRQNLPATVVWPPPLAPLTPPAAP